MKKIYTIAIATTICITSFEQSTTDEAKRETNASVAALTTTKDLKDGWAKSGSLAFNLSEAGRNAAWGEIKGGEEQTIGIKALIDYDFDLKYGKNSWLNNIRARYGLAKTTSAGEGFNKTDDYLSYTLIYAREIKKNWNFSALFNVETQFDFYFLSPGSIKFGPGIMYKPNTHFSAMFSPVMANLTTKLATEHSGLPLFGVDSFKTTRLGLGSFLQIKANYDVAKSVNYKGFVTFFSNYLNQPGTIIMDWTNLFTMTVNEYLGASLSINLRNNAFETGNLQIQHGIGVGFSYKL